MIFATYYMLQTQYNKHLPKHYGLHHQHKKYTVFVEAWIFPHEIFNILGIKWTGHVMNISVSSELDQRITNITTQCSNSSNTISFAAGKIVPSSAAPV